jgi:hypothetical protein
MSCFYTSHLKRGEKLLYEAPAPLDNVKTSYSSLNTVRNKKNVSPTNAAVKEIADNEILFSEVPYAKPGNVTGVWEP